MLEARFRTHLSKLDVGAGNGTSSTDKARARLKRLQILEVFPKLLTYQEARAHHGAKIDGRPGKESN